MPAFVCHHSRSPSSVARHRAALKVSICTCTRLVDLTDTKTSGLGRTHAWTRRPVAWGLWGPAGDWPVGPAGERLPIKWRAPNSHSLRASTKECQQIQGGFGSDGEPGDAAGAFLDDN